MAVVEKATTWRLLDRELDLSAPLAAGIVNVTDDSFYSGARSGTPEQAIADGSALADAGFDLLDVGAVAAASGPPVPAEVEAAKVVPAVAGLAERTGLPISVDTFSSLVGAEAVAAGAGIVNDIGGGQPEMLDAIAAAGCGYVLMHIEGPPRSERPARSYDDVVAHLLGWFDRKLAEATSRGIAEERIAIDPGLDFDLGVDDDLELLRRLGELHSLGRPLFVSLSRKDFLGAVLAGSWEARAPAEEREWATAAAATLAVAQGAQVLRLHDVSALDAVRVAGRVIGG